MAGRPLLAPVVTLRPPGSALAPAAGSRASLYVGDLDESVAEGHLYALFCQVAPVASLRVCRDVAGRSLGYGYVNFYCREDAKRALDSLNFTPANGKHIRVMFSNRDPTLRISGKANVFIKNLEPNIDGKSLSDMFGRYGTILSCKVATYFNGQSKGYGFVQFAEETSANDAIDSLNGKLVNGKQIFVGLFIRRQERPQQKISLSNYTNVYVKNLPKEFTHDDLLQEFAPFGIITSAVIMRDNDGISKCFGFVNYGESKCAIEAVKSLNGKMIKDTILYVGRAQNKSERQAELKANFERARNEKFKKFEGFNLYVKNLDDNINDQNLRGLFEIFGEIGSSKVMVDSQGRSKGYGFVSFTTIEAVHNAINGMNRKIVGKKPLYVGVAQRKEERRAMLVAHFARVQNLGVVAPAVPQNVAPRQFYFGPGVPGMFPTQVPGFGYQQFQQQHFTPWVPSGMVPYTYNVPRPLHHASRGVHPEINLQQQMVYPNANQAFTYLPNAMNVNANSVMVPPGFVQTDSTVCAPSVPSKNTTITAVDSSDPEKQHLIQGKKLYPLAEQLEPELGGKVTGMLGEAIEGLQGRKVEEASDTVDLASVPSSLTLSASNDATGPTSAPSSSSASGDAANRASAPSSSSA